MVFKNEIENKLLPLFESKKCAVLDAPTYSNVGDQLIWAGMEEFFANNNIECVYRCTCNTFSYKELSIDIVICLVGGGNFGDMWRDLQELKNKIVQLYPNNRIVVFPQSVYYSNLSLCEYDSAIFKDHNDLYICVRDIVSFEFVKKHFKNNVLLVPDMVLYLSFQSQESVNGKILFMQREDKERVGNTIFRNDNIEVCDWPTHTSISTDQINLFMKHFDFGHKFLRMVLRVIKCSSLIRMVYHLSSLRLQRKLLCDTISRSEKWRMVALEINYLLYLNNKNKGVLDDSIVRMLHKYQLPLITEYAVEFMNGYDEVFSTRLHGGILAMLLGKKVFFIDNSYGKISAVYKTWLSDNPNVKMLD